MCRQSCSMSRATSISRLSLGTKDAGRDEGDDGGGLRLL
jgi:hypothetical protein